MNNMKTKAKMTVKEAAEHLGITPRGVRWHIDQGHIKSDRSQGRMHLIPISEVEKLIGLKPGPKPITTV